MARRLPRASKARRRHWWRETREEALTHIDTATQMMLEQKQSEGIPPRPDETVPNCVVLTFAAEGETE